MSDRTYRWHDRVPTTDPLRRPSVPNWLAQLGMLAWLLYLSVREHVCDDLQCAFDCQDARLDTRPTAEWAGGFIL